MTISTKGLEAVLMPLIDSLAPPKREPKCKLCKLIKELIEEELGVNMQSELLLRFILHPCEKDPKKMKLKLIEIKDKLTEIIENG